MKNELEIFTNFANTLDEITSVYEEFFNSLKKLTNALKSSPPENFTETHKQLETIILKIRLLEEIRLKQVKVISDHTGIEEESLTLSALVDIAPSPVNQRFNDIKTRLSSIINNVANSTKYTKNLLESSIVTIENTVNFIKSICTANPVYLKSGQIETPHSQASFFAQKV